MIASGVEIIRWAVQQCEAAKIPPTDAAILEQVRSCRNIFAVLGYSTVGDRQETQLVTEDCGVSYVMRGGKPTTLDGKAIRFGRKGK